jgi:hypothetical protein
VNTQIDKTVGDSRAAVLNHSAVPRMVLSTTRTRAGWSDIHAVRLLGFAGSTVDRERQRVERMAADMNGLVGDQRDQGGQQCRRRPLGAPSQAAQFTGLAQRIPARLTVAMRSTPNKETDP